MRFIIPFFLLIFLFISAKSVAQDAAFEAFLRKFPKASLPYNCVVKPKVKFAKSTQITKLEAEDFLSGFKNTDGRAVNHYEAVIEPFGPEKTEDGRMILSKAKAHRVALLQRNDKYVLVLIRLKFENKGPDNMEGEQYLLHSFTAKGQPLTVLPLAQFVQFDLHSNRVSGKIDTTGNISTLVEIFAPSDNSKREEKYRISEAGIIEQVKE